MYDFYFLMNVLFICGGFLYYLGGIFRKVIIEHKKAEIKDMFLFPK